MVIYAPSRNRCQAIASELPPPTRRHTPDRMITQDDIKQLAHLARIKIDPDSIGEVTAGIDNILAMVDTMQSVDTRAVAPMANPHDAHQRLRPDTVTETDQRELFQSQAPLTEAGLYLVPKVID